MGSAGAFHRRRIGGDAEAPPREPSPRPRPAATSRSSGSSSGPWPRSRRRSASTSPRSRSSSTTSRRPDQLRDNDMDPDDGLYGLYEGVPITEYGADWVAMPNRITLFRLAARGGLPRPGRSRRRGPDHGHPRARPSPRHRRRPARRAGRRLDATSRRARPAPATHRPRTMSASIGRVTQPRPGRSGALGGGPAPGRGPPSSRSSSGTRRPAGRRSSAAIVTSSDPMATTQTRTISDRHDRRRHATRRSRARPRRRAGHDVEPRAEREDLDVARRPCPRGPPAARGASGRVPPRRAADRLRSPRRRRG